MRIPVAATALLVGGVSLALAVEPAGETKSLAPDRISHTDIAGHSVSLTSIRLHGLRVFTTAFTKLDGHGDGPVNPNDTRSPGGRPTLGGNGSVLRVNGLDSQSCLECHSLVSAATFPPTLGIGGAGGIAASAFPGPTVFDVADENTDGTAEFDGRLINPPFTFGAGGVELLAKEMTADLQELREDAIDDPGTEIELETHGVDFGSITADGNGGVDTTKVEGIDDDLVVRPFGRKGNNLSMREFDMNAFAFHMGMQPAEVVGQGVDADGDGVTDELLEGDLSALSIFLATLDRPRTGRLNGDARRGRKAFDEIGCASCHVPALETRSRILNFCFPEVPTEPFENPYYGVDLSDEPVRFALNDEGGVTVRLFADLKRHDMGPGMMESLAGATAKQNREFTTARLWGVADTAPYMHDGRSLTLTDAILAHGGEALDARNQFDNLNDSEKEELLAFLRCLRTPKNPARSLIRLARR